MRSTFMGLEANKRGLFSQQSGLYTTGHNISNANTIGYSRQRVNLQATAGFPTAGLNSPTFPGHMGTGVEVGSVQRIRDEFIDRQYRQETNKLGYWESRTKAISQIEDIMNEPSEFGIDAAFNVFWQSLQDVSKEPADISARTVAIERAKHLAESFNYVNTQLETIQGNLGNEINVSVSEINALLRQISSINKQVQEVEPNGYVPNDLYDKRDVLVDQLNEYLPVSIQRVKSGGNVSDVAEGTLTITFNGVELVNGNKFVQMSASGTLNNAPVNGDNPANAFSTLNLTKLATVEEHNSTTPPTFDAKSFKQSDFDSSKGKLLSLINSYGYDNGTGVQGYYPETMTKLDELVSVFAQVFNAMHKEGYNLNGVKETENFFVGDGGTPPKFTAANIKVNEEFIKDPSKLAASSGKDEEGNGKWAIELANLQNKNIGATGITVNVDGKTHIITWGDTTATPPNIPNLGGATFQSFYKAIIGKLGVDGREAANLYDTAGTQLLAISNNRDSMSSVSLDEEMTNMIMFQQAYNANARMITVVDETLDKIINGMGRVGL